uniref:Coronin-7 n=1 Tax=Panagrolaimus sp. JU765 TaxID=591449 RepID=A0AC34QGQ2_9BILA
MVSKTSTAFLNLDLKYPNDKSNTLYGLPVDSISSTHNNITCNRHHIIFQCSSTNNRLAVLPISTRGAIGYPQLNHVLVGNEEITDFSVINYPAEKELIAIASKSGPLKLFDLAEFNDETGKSVGTPFSVYDSLTGNISTLSSHPTIDYLIGCGGLNGYDIVDLDAGKSVFSGLSGSHVKSLAWDALGHLLIVLYQKKNELVASSIDVRANEIVHEYVAHQGPGRECRIIGAGKFNVSTGFDKSRKQEMQIFDRNAGKIVVRRLFDSSTSILIPLYDKDSDRLFYGAKGSNTICSAILSTFNSATQPNFCRTPEPSLGLSLMPKTNVDVMGNEVQRIHQLNKSGISPIPVLAIRRQESVFRPELFPDTAGLESGGNIQQWIEKNDRPVPLISLRPHDAPSYTFIGGSGVTRIGDVVIHLGNGTNKDEKHQSGVVPDVVDVVTDNAEKKENKNPEQVIVTNKPNGSPEASAKDVPTPPMRKSINTVKEKKVKKETSSVKGGGRKIYEARSSYYNIAPKIGLSITSIRNINTRIPAEGTFFGASAKFAAVPLDNIEGHLGIFNLNVTGKIPDGTMDGFLNHSAILDLQFDPFNDYKILCALNNGSIKIWNISNADVCEKTKDHYCTNVVPPKPEKGPGMLNVDVADVHNYQTLSKLEPDFVFACGFPRVIQARYNPVVPNLIAVGGSDGSLALIDAERQECLYKVKTHPTTIVSLAWNTEGNRIVTIDRNNKTIISDARDGSILSSSDAIGSNMRSPRVIYVGPIGNEMLLFTYLEGGKRHKVILADEELEVLKNIEIGVSQGGQSMRAYYDYDSALVFITTKGDSGLKIFHISEHEPYFLDIMPTTYSSQHQAICLMSKKVVDPHVNEIVRVPRLTQNSIEMTSLNVPRREKDVYLRELYPLALATWLPSTTFEDWQSGIDYERKFIDLKPDNLIEIHFHGNQDAPETPKIVENHVENQDVESLVKEVHKGWSDRIAVEEPEKNLDDESGEWED